MSESYSILFIDQWLQELEFRICNIRILLLLLQCRTNYLKIGRISIALFTS